MKIIGNPKDQMLVKARRKPEGRARDPDSIQAKAEELGMHESTLRKRLKLVEKGEMTLEEAYTRPIATRAENGRKAAKKTPPLHY